MKKFILMFVALFATLTANAQIATENPKFFDNWSLGIGGGVTSPLDFNSTFPVNAGVGLQLTKDITPVLGLQGEGATTFQHDSERLRKIAHLRRQVEAEPLHVLRLDFEPVAAEILGEDARTVLPVARHERVRLELHPSTRCPARAARSRPPRSCPPSLRSAPASVPASDAPPPDASCRRA